MRVWRASVVKKADMVLARLFYCDGLVQSILSDGETGPFRFVMASIVMVLRMVTPFSILGTTYSATGYRLRSCR